MAYCKNCGTYMDDRANTCPSCGFQQSPVSPVTDNGGIGWGILGCCIPIVGLVLFLVWKDQKPKTAKAAGIGALVSVGLYVLWYVIVVATGIGAAMML